jgi:hypothetical protein
MKKLFTLLILIFAFSCNEPMQVTGHPDDRAATSGTLGSAKAENQLPNAAGDSANHADTLKHK